MGKSSRTKGKERESSSGTPGWWAQNRQIVTFAATFLGLLTLFQIAYYTVVVPSSIFAKYLGLNSRVAAKVLGLMGEKVMTSGDMMFSTFSMSIKTGCDGLQAMAILAIAVAAFPGEPRRKLIGAAGGIALLMVLNILRLVSLFWMGVHVPDWFQAMHVHIWPAALIIAALVYAVAWSSWTSRRVAAA